MAAPSAPPRSSQPVAPDTEDMVLARALEFAAWARRNAIAVTIVAVLIAVVVGGTIYYRTYQADRSARAAADFMQLDQSAAMVADPAIVGADLERFIAQYDGTQYADEARVLLGRLRLNAGQPAEAIPVLQEAARRVSRSPIGAQAGLLLGAAHEQADNPTAALQAYMSVGRDARFNFEQRQGLESAAALRYASGEYAESAAIYRQLVERAEEGTFDRSVYEMRLAEAEALAQQS
jgi:predicted negative regulator of RcsB-dependent stress response